MDNVTTVGIDLAKNVFSVHGVDAHGAVVLRRTVSRAKLVQVVAQLPACLIGLEACSGAHEWARQFQRFGHTVKLMAPKFVAPYRKSGKNDGNDAEAICEAVGRPSMRFVPIKSLEQHRDHQPGAWRVGRIWHGHRAARHRGTPPGTRAARAPACACRALQR